MGSVQMECREPAIVAIDTYVDTLIPSFLTFIEYCSQMFVLNLN